MDGIHIIGVGMTPFGKQPGRTVRSLTHDAVTAALADAGCAVGAIQAAWFANTRQALLEGQNTVRGQVALRPLGIAGIPVANVENACASASTALLQAAAHLAAGFCDVALVVGAERMVVPDRPEAMAAAFLGGTDVTALEETRARIAALGAGLVPPDGADPGGARSLFMDIYAGIARLHMERYGTRREDFARLAAKNHRHAVHNPLAQYRTAMTPDAVLADRPIVWPLTRAMCAPVGDGAAAAVVVNAAGLRRLGGAARAIRLRGMALRSAGLRDIADFDRHAGRLAAWEAYERAGVGPEDVDVAEVHDATSSAELVQIENLGLAPRGGVGARLRAGAFALGGACPVNPSGGLVAKGHPVGATGLAQIVELVTQLRGEAGPRQVPGARVAVAENGGGFLDVEEAATVVTVLGR